LRPLSCWSASVRRSSTPHDQTCCGQPMANSGFNADCAATEALFVRNFSGFDYIVAPSGSCVHHVRDNLMRSNKLTK
jgi:Fe-S oxidoreductase